MSYTEKDIERECQHFQKIAESLIDLKRRKAGDYGNSWRVMGLGGIIYVIGGKFTRIWNITKGAKNFSKEVNNESLRDTFRDMAVYCIMAIQMLDEGKLDDAFSSFGADFDADERTYQTPKAEAAEDTKKW